MALKKGLGKGLGALIDNASQSTKPAEPSNNIENNTTTETKSGTIEVDINKVEPNKDQPRKYFDQEALEELATSISEYGIIQPILVKDEGSYYSIIAGERRWRAARIAKITTVPVIIKDYNPVEILQVALIENIQRMDLNPIEEAECFRRLRDDYFFNQEDIAKKLGKSRNSISQSLSLLNLDSRVQNFVSEGKLSSGHGKNLLQIDDVNEQFDISEHIIENQLSLKDAAEYIKKYNEDLTKVEEKTVPVKENPYEFAQKEMEHILGTKVNVKKKKIEIEFYSEEELDRLLTMIKRLS